MRCHKCGKKVSAKAKFCSGCGANLLELAQDKRRFGRNRCKKNAMLIMAVLAVLVSLGVYFLNRPDEAYQRDTDLISTEPGDFRCIGLSDFDLEIGDGRSALEVLTDISGLLGLEDTSDELALKTENAVNGTRYYRFEQRYHDIPVYGKSVVLSADRDGKADILTGNIVPIVNVATGDCPAEDAVRIAEDYLGYECEYTEPTQYYYEMENGDMHLVWLVDCQTVDVFVDTVTGSVIKVSSRVDYDSITVRGQRQERTVDVSISDGMITFFDEARNIKVYEAENVDKWAWMGGATGGHQKRSILESETIISYPQTETADYPSAVDAFANIAVAYDFYNTLFHYCSTDGDGQAVIKIVDGVDVLWNESTKEYRSSIDNALSQSNRALPETIIYVGLRGKANDTTAACLDVMAHEYTHAVNQFISGLEGEKGETGAVNEALSDIMGEMVEAWSGGTCNWIHGDNVRDLANPERSSGLGTYPIWYGDYKENMNEHNGSTILSHAAWLMWTGSEENRLSAIDEVSAFSELWFRTMLLLNSDATFSDCRTCCEAAAMQMKERGLLTSRQYDCVVWAFDQAGIHYTAQAYMGGMGVFAAGGQVQFKVYDASGNAANNYCLTVTDQAGRIIDTITVADAEPVRLSLNAGAYRIAVDSLEAEYPRAYAVVTVSKRKLFVLYTDAVLDIYTSFGTGITGVVTDDTRKPLEGTKVTAVSAAVTSGEDRENTAFPAGNLSETVETVTGVDGDFTMNLPAGTYVLHFEREGYQEKNLTVTVKLHENGGKYNCGTVELEQEKVITPEDAYAAYEEILNEYRAACAIGSEEYLNNMEGYERQYPNVNPMVMEQYHILFHSSPVSGSQDQSYALVYTYYDIDSNGISELLIARAFQSTDICDVYTYDGEKAVKLLPSMTLLDGYSCLWICTDGTIMVSSDGTYYYQLSGDGYTLEERMRTDAAINFEFGGWQILADDIGSLDFSDVIESYEAALCELEGSNFTLVMDADVSITATDGYQTESMMEYIDFSAKINHNNNDDMVMSGSCELEADDTNIAYTYYYENGLTYCAYTSPRSQKVAMYMQPVSGMLNFPDELTNEDLNYADELDGIIEMSIDSSVFDFSGLLEELLGESYDCSCDTVLLTLEKDSEGRPLCLTFNFELRLNVYDADVTAWFNESVTFQDYGSTVVDRPDDLETYVKLQ